jgi:uncharacterized UBP type Zn finger protein
MTPYEINQIVVVCLQRFKENDLKDDREVEVPVTLKAGEFGNRFFEDDSVYKLYGIINYRGINTKFGHYTATCFDECNGWVSYNDSWCSKIDL